MEDGNSDGGDSISSMSSSFVECSLNESIKTMKFDDELARRVGPACILIKNSGDLEKQQIKK